MRKLLIFVLPLGLILTGCRMQIGNRLVNGNGSPTALTLPTETPVLIPSPEPSQTDVPTATDTPMPTPDLSLIGLPAEPAGTTALDFVGTMCKAQWFTDLQNLPCPGNDTLTDTGYVMQSNGSLPGVQPNINLLLVFPPKINAPTIYSKYPAFTVKKGDRFRAVLTCLPHKFCDVEFGLKHWPYLFTDVPVVVDYSLDRLAGQTVQFDLSVRSLGSGADNYAVWMAPHIYRPLP